MSTLEITEDGATLRWHRTRWLPLVLVFQPHVLFVIFLVMSCADPSLAIQGSDLLSWALIASLVAAAIGIGLTRVKRPSPDVSVWNGRLSWRTWRGRSELALSEVADLEQHPTTLRIALRSRAIRWVSFPAPSEATSRFLDVVRSQLEVASDGAAAAEVGREALGGLREQAARTRPVEFDR